MKHARASVLDEATGAALIADPLPTQRILIRGLFISFSDQQSLRLENTDGTLIAAFRQPGSAVPINFPPGRALWQSVKGQGVQIDSDTIDAAATGVIEVDIWFDIINGDTDVFSS